MSERVAVEGRQTGVPSSVYSVASVTGLLLLWAVVTHLGWVGPGYLPGPKAMFEQLLTLLDHGYGGKPLSDHIGASLFRALVGFAIGVLAGVPFGLFSGYHKAVGAMMSPIMAFIRPIPPIAFIPMAVLYFGLGETGKVVLIVFTAFNYSFVSAQAGALSVPVSYYRAAESLGMRKLQIFWQVVFPSAIPHMFTGLKVAMALSWAVVVAAELVGAQKGLGFMISDAAQLFQIPVVFIGIALIGLIGLVLNGLLTVAEDRIVHWKGR
ncbi:ABC transporter permease [Bordetella trematum]|uniref:ABC transporter permease n=1 Tax=Bordetella trematum TaxID=123899 RepID=UPI003989A00E